MSNERREQRGYYSPDQDIHFKMTTPEEETALFHLSKGTDDAAEAARTFLIHNHLMFARSEALKLAKGALPEDEVVSAANLAIMKAMKSFDPSNGNRFTVYLRPFIRGEIAALWETKYSCPGVLDPSQAGQYSMSVESRQAQQDTLHHPDFDGQINFGKHVSSRSLGSDGGEDHPSETLDLKQFNRTQLAEALATLKPAEQELIESVYVRGMSYVATGLARTPPVSRERIRAQHNEVIKKLHRRLTKRGVRDVL